MSRRCEITGKGPMVGNTVSHAKNRNRRRFLPNLQDVSLFSTVLGKSVKVRATHHGVRTVEHNGGLDAYLLGTGTSKLSPEMLKVRKLLLANGGEVIRHEPKPRREPVSKRALKKRAAKAA